MEKDFGSPSRAAYRGASSSDLKARLSNQTKKEFDASSYNTDIND